MNRLNTKQRAQIIHALLEGNSIHGTCRLTGRSKRAVDRLLVDAGRACAAEHQRLVRNLHCSRIQVDEMWSFCAMKQRNVPEDKAGQLGYGDLWTFIAIDPDTKLIPTWLVGHRDMDTASRFLRDLGRRIVGRFQLSSDAANFYAVTVMETLGMRVDYAQVQKTYTNENGRQYVTGSIRVPMIGDPVPEHISTSIVERQNHTVRMQIRRYARRTNAYSRKVLQHQCAVAIHMLHYNFARPHSTLTKRNRGIYTTPAIEAGLARRIWKVEDIVALVEADEESAKDVARRVYAV